MPGRERERDRERDNAIGRSEFDRLQKGHEMLEAQVERVAAVAVRVASDAGEARADLQLVFFLQGRSRARVLETIAKYNDDKPGVQDGAKEKGAPLKCYIYDFPTEPSIGNRGKLAVLSAFRVRSGELKMQRSCRRCRSRSRLLLGPSMARQRSAQYRSVKRSTKKAARRLLNQWWATKVAHIQLDVDTKSPNHQFAGYGEFLYPVVSLVQSFVTQTRTGTFC